MSWEDEAILIGEAKTEPWEGEAVDLQPEMSPERRALLDYQLSLTDEVMRRYPFGQLTVVLDEEMAERLGPDSFFGGEDKTRLVNTVMYSRLLAEDPESLYFYTDVINEHLYGATSNISAADKNIKTFEQSKSYMQAIGDGLRVAGIQMVEDLRKAGWMVADLDEAFWDMIGAKQPGFLKSMDEQQREMTEISLAAIQQWYKENPDRLMEIAPGTGYLQKARWYIFDPKGRRASVQAAFQSAPIMMLAVMGKVAGLGKKGIIALFGGPVTGQVYHDARQEGTEVTPALGQALLSGAGEGAIEEWTFGKKIGLAQNFPKILKAGFGKVAWEALKTYGRGTVEEATQQINRNFWRLVFTDASQQIMEGVGDSAAVGGPAELLMGGGFGMGGYVLNKTADLISPPDQHKRIDRLEAAIRANDTLTDQEKAEILDELAQVRKDIDAGVYVEEELTPEQKAAIDIEVRAAGRIRWLEARTQELRSRKAYLAQEEVAELKRLDAELKTLKAEREARAKAAKAAEPTVEPVGKLAAPEAAEGVLARIDKLLEENPEATPAEIVGELIGKPGLQAADMTTEDVLAADEYLRQQGWASASHFIEWATGQRVGQAVEDRRIQEQAARLREIFAEHIKPPVTPEAEQKAKLRQRAQELSRKPEFLTEKEEAELDKIEKELATMERPKRHKAARRRPLGRLQLQRQRAEVGRRLETAEAQDVAALEDERDRLEDILAQLEPENLQGMTKKALKAVARRMRLKVPKNADHDYLARLIEGPRITETEGRFLLEVPTTEGWDASTHANYEGAYRAAFGRKPISRQREYWLNDTERKRYNVALPAPDPFYSKLVKALEDFPEKNVHPLLLLEYLRREGVKEGELELSKVKEHLVAKIGRDPNLSAEDANNLKFLANMPEAQRSKDNKKLYKSLRKLIDPNHTVETDSLAFAVPKIGYLTEEVFAWVPRTAIQRERQSDDDIYEPEWDDGYQTEPDDDVVAEQAAENFHEDWEYNREQFETQIEEIQEEAIADLEADVAEIGDEAENDYILDYEIHPPSPYIETRSLFGGHIDEPKSGIEVLEWDWERIREGVWEREEEYYHQRAYEWEQENQPTEYTDQANGWTIRDHPDGEAFLNTDQYGEEYFGNADEAMARAYDIYQEWLDEQDELREEPEPAQITGEVEQAQDPLAPIVLGTPQYAGYVTPGARKYREIFVAMPNLPGQWRDGHSYDSFRRMTNPVVRLRLSERMYEGKPVFYIDEIQPPAKGRPGFPGPFFSMPKYWQAHWYERGFKQALYMAVREGYEYLAWSTRELQLQISMRTDQKVSDIYDKVLPSFVRKYLKDFGIEIEMPTITMSQGVEAPVHLIRITPELANFIKTTPQPLYSVRVPSSLGQIAKVGVNMEDADFWLQRKGSTTTVGRPTKDFSPENIGIKILRPDLLNADYGFYAFQNLYNQGYFQQLAHGATGLQNIRVSDVKKLGIGRPPAGPMQIDTLTLPENMAGRIREWATTTSGDVFDQDFFMPMGVTDENGDTHLVGVDKTMQLPAEVVQYINELQQLPVFQKYFALRIDLRPPEFNEAAARSSMGDYAYEQAMANGQEPTTAAYIGKNGRRIEIVLYTSALGRIGDIAHEVAHAALYLIRARSPKHYQAIEKWYQARLDQGAHPSLKLPEAWARAFEYAHEGLFKIDGEDIALPRWVADYADAIMREDHSQETIDKALGYWAEEGEHYKVADEGDLIVPEDIHAKGEQFQPQAKKGRGLTQAEVELFGPEFSKLAKWAQIHDEPVGYKQGVADRAETARAAIDTLRKRDKLRRENRVDAANMILTFVPKEHQGRFIRRAMGVNTQEALAKFADALEAWVDEWELRQLIKEFGEFQKKVKKKARRGEAPFGMLPSALAARMDDLINKFDVKKLSERKAEQLESRQEWYQRLTAALADGYEAVSEDYEKQAKDYLVIPQHAIDELRRLSQVPIGEVSAEEIRWTMDLVKNLYSEHGKKGRSRHRRRLEAWLKKANNARQEVAKKPVLEKWAGLLGGIAHGVGMGQSSLHTLLGRISAKEAPGMRALLWDALIEGNLKRIAKYKEFVEAWNKEVQKAGITAEDMKTLEETVDVQIGGQLVEVTRDDLLTLYAYTVADGTMKRLLTTKGLNIDTLRYKGPAGLVGYTTQQYRVGTPSLTELRAIAEQILPQHKKLVDIHFKLNREHQAPAINEVSIQIYNTELARSEKHMSVHREMPMRLSGFSMKEMAKAAEMLGRYQPRTGGKQRMNIRPFTQEVMSGIQADAFFNGMTIPIMEARSLLATERFTEAVLKAGYDSELRHIHTIINRIQAFGTDTALMDYVFGGLFREAAKSILSLRITGAAIQTASLPAAYHIIPFEHFSLRIPTKAEIEEAMEKYPELWLRWHGRHFDYAIGAISAADGFREMVLGKQALRNRMLNHYTKGDQFAVMNILRAAERMIDRTLQKGSQWDRYVKELRRQDKTMPSDEKVKAYAVRQLFGEAMETQPQWDPLYRSTMASDPGWFARGFMMFMSARNAQLNVLQRAFDDYSKGRITKEQRNRIIAQIGFANFMVSFLRQSIRLGIELAGIGFFVALGLREPPDEEEAKEMAKRLLTKLPQETVFNLVGLNAFGSILTAMGYGGIQAAKYKWSGYDARYLRTGNFGVDLFVDLSTTGISGVEFCYDLLTLNKPMETRRRHDPDYYFYDSGQRFLGSLLNILAYRLGLPASGPMSDLYYPLKRAFDEGDNKKRKQ